MAQTSQSQHPLQDNSNTFQVVNDCILHNDQTHLEQPDIRVYTRDSHDINWHHDRDFAHDRDPNLKCSFRTSFGHADVQS